VARRPRKSAISIIAEIIRERRTEERDEFTLGVRFGNLKRSKYNRMPKGLDGIMLAAGESRRMGYPKPLLRIGRQTFIEHIAGTMLAVVPRLVIVLGAHSDRVRAAIPHDARITIVENPNYARGQLSSLKVGLSAIQSHAAGALVHLGDHPMVRAEPFKRWSITTMKRATRS